MRVFLLLFALFALVQSVCYGPPVEFFWTDCLFDICQNQANKTLYPVVFNAFTSGTTGGYNWRANGTFGDFGLIANRSTDGVTINTWFITAGSVTINIYNLVIIFTSGGSVTINDGVTLHTCTNCFATAIAGQQMWTFLLNAQGASNSFTMFRNGQMIYPKQTDIALSYSNKQPIKFIINGATDNFFKTTVYPQLVSLPYIFDVLYGNGYGYQAPTPPSYCYSDTYCPIENSTDQFSAVYSRMDTMLNNLMAMNSTEYYLKAWSAASSASEASILSAVLSGNLAIGVLNNTANDIKALAASLSVREDQLITMGSTIGFNITTLSREMQNMFSVLQNQLNLNTSTIVTLMTSSILPQLQTITTMLSNMNANDTRLYDTISQWFTGTNTNLTLAINLLYQIIITTGGIKQPILDAISAVATLDVSQAILITQAIQFLKDNNSLIISYLISINDTIVNKVIVALAAMDSTQRSSMLALSSMVSGGITNLTLLAATLVAMSIAMNTTLNDFVTRLLLLEQLQENFGNLTAVYAELSLLFETFDLSSTQLATLLRVTNGNLSIVLVQLSEIQAIILDTNTTFQGLIDAIVAIGTNMANISAAVYLLIDEAAILGMQFDELILILPTIVAALQAFSNVSNLIYALQNISTAFGISITNVISIMQLTSQNITAMFEEVRSLKDTIARLNITIDQFFSLLIITNAQLIAINSTLTALVQLTASLDMEIDTFITQIPILLGLVGSLENLTILIQQIKDMGISLEMSFSQVMALINNLQGLEAIYFPALNQTLFELKNMIAPFGIQLGQLADLLIQTRGNLQLFNQTVMTILDVATRLDVSVRDLLGWWPVFVGAFGNMSDILAAINYATTNLSISIQDLVYLLPIFMSTIAVGNMISYNNSLKLIVLREFAENASISLSELLSIMRMMNYNMTSGFAALEGQLGAMMDLFQEKCTILNVTMVIYFQLLLATLAFNFADMTARTDRIEAIVLEIRANTNMSSAQILQLMTEMKLEVLQSFADLARNNSALWLMIVQQFVLTNGNVTLVARTLDSLVAAFNSFAVSVNATAGRMELKMDYLMSIIANFLITYAGDVVVIEAKLDHIAFLVEVMADNIGTQLSNVIEFVQLWFAENIPQQEAMLSTLYSLQGIANTTLPLIMRLNDQGPVVLAKVDSAVAILINNTILLNALATANPSSDLFNLIVSMVNASAEEKAQLTRYARNVDELMAVIIKDCTEDEEILNFLKANFGNYWLYIIFAVLMFLIIGIIGLALTTFLMWKQTQLYQLQLISTLARTGVSKTEQFQDPEQVGNDIVTAENFEILTESEDQPIAK